MIRNTAVLLSFPYFTVKHLSTVWTRLIMAALFVMTTEKITYFLSNWPP